MSKKSPLRTPPTKDAVHNHVGTLLDALIKSPDLPCALIAGASVENCLMLVLDSFLVDCKESTLLFEINHELDSVGKCNKLALCLGLIPRVMYENIGSIIKVRNVFAHSDVPINFDNKKISDECGKLLLPKAHDGITYTPRKTFEHAVIDTWSTLHIIAHPIEHRVEMPPMIWQNHRPR